MHGGKEASVHEGKKKYHCPLYYLDKKSKENTLCQARFSNKQGLSKHISITHLGFKQHRYQFCASKYCSKYRLKKHIKEVHEGK